jgi:carboxymethylenebutenolidase
MSRARLVTVALGIGLAGCRASSAGLAAPSASSRASVESAPQTATGEAVAFPGGGSGWLQLPATAGKHPAVLVIQEFWGMNDWIKEDVVRFASQGYVALAVDLYRGRSTSDPGEAHELMRGLPEDRAMSDMKAGFDWLAARTDVDPQRIGIVGWCMGGGYALALAVAEPRLAAAAVNYGRLVTDPAKIEAIHAAILGNFAGMDRGIEPKDVQAFAETLKKDHKDVDIKIYDGAKHAFMNPNNKDGYDAAAAKDAWARIDGWLSQKLAAR